MDVVQYAMLVWQKPNLGCLLYTWYVNNKFQRTNSLLTILIACFGVARTVVLYFVDAFFPPHNRSLSNLVSRHKLGVFGEAVEQGSLVEQQRLWSVKLFDTTRLHHHYPAGEKKHAAAFTISSVFTVKQTLQILLVT